MTAIICPTVKYPGEQVHSFMERRSRNAGRLAKTCGKWSRQWARDVINWEDHCNRGNDATNWNNFIIDYRAEDWLNQRRLMHTTSGGEVRTQTRASRAKVNKRYFEGCKEAMEFLLRTEP